MSTILATCIAINLKDFTANINNGRISVNDQACSNCSSRLRCRNPDVIPIEPIDGWYITGTGDVYVDGTIRDVSEYCIDVQDGSHQLFCPLDNVNKTTTIVKIFICLSCLSIFIIIILHVVIKDLRVIYFTKLKIPFLVCLFFVNLELLIPISTSTCVVRGLSFQYMFLIMCFWLTSMSMDIWLTFRKLSNPLRNQNKKDIVHKIFRYYIFSL